jgi:hypothetical protein
MRRLRWPEILFIACFLLFGVGGGVAWPSENIVDAMIGLLVGTVAGVLVWLGLLFFIVRGRSRQGRGETGQPRARREKPSRPTGQP